MYRFLLILLASASLFSLGPARGGTGDPLAAQRQQFLAAEKALQSRNLKRFRQLQRTLADYPLQPYLEYQYLKSRLAHSSKREIRSFLTRYAATPLAGLLHARWLNHLGRKARWKDYLAFYEPQQNVRRQCHYLNALLHTGQAAKALPMVEALWLHGESRPKACDPVFEAWEDAGLRSDELTWKRIALAMEEGEWRLARYLGKTLPEAGQRWLQRWTGLYRNPAKWLSRLDEFDTPHPFRETMLSQGIRRLAARDKLGALTAWMALRTRFEFDSRLTRKTERSLTFALIRQVDPTVYEFLQNVQACNRDSRLQEARIRAALLRQDWQQVLSWVEQLPEEDQVSSRWRYWRARALGQTGQGAAAAAAYSDLAVERDYYGFLAADRVGAPYMLSHRETPADAQDIERLSALPGIRRATELFILERWIDGRREWRHATAGLPDRDLMAAARLAQERGWPDQAIFTLARSDYWDDLELRFPLIHGQTIRRESARQGLNEHFVYAVVRQESAFMPQARSPAGAVGLMQLMPATARQVAKRKLKRKPPQRRELLDPPTNISLGSAYLRQMLDRFDDNDVLAIAAYNAGPHRVKRWLPESRTPADIWIELVPFRETRGYLRRVLAYKAIYQSRLGREPLKLREVMPDIPPAA